MTLPLMTPEAMERYERLYRTVLARGPSVTLAQLGKQHGPPRKLEAGPKRDRRSRAVGGSGAMEGVER